MKKIIGIIVDAFMYLLLVGQMLYIFEGNTAHEILGIGFFVCFIVHIIIKRKWFSKYKAGFSKMKKTKARIMADVFIWLLLADIILLMLSSLSVSRTLFPAINIIGGPALHRYLATGALTLAVLHGSMHMYNKMKSKKKAVIIMVVLAGVSLYLGLGLVPYLNRHFRKVDVQLNSSISGEKLHTDKNILTVYFTRLGNTDFVQDVDAVSGASLLIADGELMGNTQMLAMMVQDAIGCDIEAITLTGEKYPSSYNDTIAVAVKEIKNDARPAIESIDITGYDEIILVYPIWWGTIPNPVTTFLDENDFAGKKVHMLATQGSSGFATSVRDVQKLIPDAEVIEGISIYCDDIPKCREQIGKWLEKIVR